MRVVVFGLLTTLTYAHAAPVEMKCRVAATEWLEDLDAQHVQYECQPHPHGLSKHGQGPQGQGPKPKTYRWEQLPDGSWRLTEVKGSSTPAPTPPVPSRTPSKNPPPRSNPPPAIPPDDVDWFLHFGAGSGSDMGSKHLGVEFNRTKYDWNGKKVIKLGLHYRTHALKDSMAQRYEDNKNLSEWNFKWTETSHEGAGGEVQLTRGLVVDADERFLIQSHARAIIRGEYGGQTGIFRRLYAGADLSLGALKHAGQTQ